MAEEMTVPKSFEKTMKKVADASKKPNEGKAKQALAVQIVDKSGKVETKGTGEVEEKRKKATQDKQQLSLWQKISAGFSAKRKEGEEKFKGTWWDKLKKAFLTGALILLIPWVIKLLEDGTWKKMIKWIKETIIPGLKYLWKEIIKPLGIWLWDTMIPALKALVDYVGDPTWPKFKKLFTEHKAALGILAGIVAVKSFGISGMIGGASLAAKGMKAAWGSKAVAKGLSVLKQGPLGPLAIIAGIALMIKDGMEAMKLSEKWGTSKTSAAMGGVLGGMDKGFMGAFKNMGKWALIGAGIGSFVPVVGTLIGGVIGAVIGAILGWIGGERIAKAFQAVGKWFSEKWTEVTGWIKEIATKVKNWVVEKFTFAKNLVIEGWTTLTAKITEVFDNVVTWFTEKWSFIKTSAIKGWSTLTAKVTEVFDNVVTWFTEKFTFAKDTAIKIGGKVFDAAVWAGEMASNIWETIKEFFWAKDGKSGILQFTLPEIKLKMPDLGLDWSKLENPFAGIIDSIGQSDFFKDAKSPWAWKSPIESAKGVIKNALTSIFGPLGTDVGEGSIYSAMAKGGTFQKGEGILVGEIGPEIIIPGGSGTVIPNNKIGGGDERMVKVLEALTAQLASGTGDTAINAPTTNVTTAPTTVINGPSNARQRVVVNG